MEWRMSEGANFDEAVASLLKTMGADISEVEIEKLGEHKKLFGLGGAVMRVRGRLKEDAVSGERLHHTEPKPRHSRTAPELSGSEIAEIGEKAAAFLRQIIEKMGVSDSSVNVSVENGEIKLKIVDNNKPFPVGDDGEVLEAVQTLVSIYIGRLHEGKARVTVDAGDFRNARVEKLKEIALKAADDAIKGKKVYLGPMKSPERKIVHAALQDNQAVYTKSHGEGDRRQVVVYPSNKSRQ